MKIWAHRGSHGGNGLLENSLPAFEKAVDEGADGIELDVHLSQDGVPVVFHDENLARLTPNCDMRTVSEVTSDELTSIDLLGGFKMPLLEEVLIQLGDRVHLNIEIKDAEAVRAVVELLNRTQVSDVILSSFSSVALEYAAKHKPDIPRAWISGDMPASPIELEQSRWPLGPLCRTQATRWHTSPFFCSSLLVGHLALRGISTHVWTVNSAECAAGLLRQGVAGVFTDHPGLMRRYLVGGASRLPGGA